MIQDIHDAIVAQSITRVQAEVEMQTALLRLEKAYATAEGYLKEWYDVE